MGNNLRRASGAKETSHVNDSCVRHSLDVVVAGVPGRSRLCRGRADVQDRETRAAKTHCGVYIARQTVGDGPVDIAWRSDRLGNVDTTGS